jgi:hypothetical protein
MAKELPYFKFYSSEWLNGDITLEDYDVQGIFVNICAYYWSKDCELSKTNLFKRFKGSEKLIETLIKSNIIKIEKDNLIISFLNEQMKSKEVQAVTNRINGLKGGRPPKEKPNDNPIGLISLTETKPNDNPNETNIKESKVKESKIYVSEKSTPTDYDKFLQWFNTTRTKYLEIPSHINRLTQIDKSNLEILKKSYSNDEFNIALLNLCNDRWANESNLILPNHFLKEENFVKYLNMPQRKLLTKREKQIAGLGV